MPTSRTGRLPGASIVTQVALKPMGRERFVSANKFRRHRWSTAAAGALFPTTLNLAVIATRPSGAATGAAPDYGLVESAGLPTLQSTLPASAPTLVLGEPSNHLRGVEGGRRGREAGRNGVAGDAGAAHSDPDAVVLLGSIRSRTRITPGPFVYSGACEPTKVEAVPLPRRDAAIGHARQRGG
jgi:hypothetical protein